MKFGCLSSGLCRVFGEHVQIICVMFRAMWCATLSGCQLTHASAFSLPVATDVRWHMGIKAVQPPGKMVQLEIEDLSAHFCPCQCFRAILTILAIIDR